MIKFTVKVFKRVTSLLEGMAVTIKYFFSGPVTMQYPDKKWTLPERARGVVTLIIDKETGKHRCIACLACVRTCPNFSLAVEVKTDENKKRYPGKFTLELGKCMFCGLCVDSCPTKALMMNNEYELAVYTRKELTRSLLP
ncbi:MAG: 4Fe-4S binding protein [Candidatus Omnitrophica bacterium]|nr:4Fe-4S binding protein [Candidatus Omnitrophota bacterium]